MNNGLLGPAGSEPLDWTRGMIMAWYGDLAAPPVGWAVCDGTQGTPDLRNRFIVGAGSTYAVGATGGGVTTAYTPTGDVSVPTFTGDALAGHTHDEGTLGADSNGAHTHTFTSGAPSATTAVQTGVADVDVGSDTHTHSGTTDSDGAHTHTVTGTTSSTSGGTPSGTISQPTFTGDAANVSTLSPYFGLYLKMYIGEGAA